MKQRFAMKRISPERYSTGGDGSRRKIDSAVTLLPEPDSPTSASVSPASVAVVKHHRLLYVRFADGENPPTNFQSLTEFASCYTALLGSNASRTASPIKISKDNNIATDKKAVIPAMGPEGYFSLVTAVHRVTVNRAADRSRGNRVRSGWLSNYIK